MMCLIAFAWKVDPERPLVLIANRDESHARPAAPLSFWADAPDICAGRDLRERGTWLGVHRRGRLAAVTNVRESLEPQAMPRSRGALIPEFLSSRLSAAEYADTLAEHAADYGAYNLLLWDGESLFYASNRPRPVHFEIQPGVHGLSNAQLDTPWPKVGRATRSLQRWLEAHGSEDSVFDAMADREAAPDAELPDTGVGLEAERLLSSPFIYRPGYGTRCTTWVDIGRDRHVTLRERRYDSLGATDGETIERFGFWPRQAAAAHSA